MSDGDGGGRGNRAGSGPSDQRSERADRGVDVWVGRRTLVEQAMSGLPPVQAKLDGSTKQDPAAERDAHHVAAHAGFGGNATAVARTGLQVQRADPAKVTHGMDRARYQTIERQLKNFVAQKKGLVDGSGKGDMATIDAEIDKLIAELRVDFGVQLDRGKILDNAMAGKDMLVMDGRIVLSPSGTSHYMGERLGAKREIDHVPHGETLRIGWRWRTPAVDRRLAELGATEQHVGAELAEPSTAHHLRETNFADRGTRANPSGRVIKVHVSGKGTPVPVETPSFVRLEPIPPGASGGAHSTRIDRVEVEARRSDTPSKAVVKGDLVRGPTDWEVPIPGNPYPKVFVEISPGGLVPYTSVEAPPPGTRIQIKPRDVANSGFAGGHTRETWNAVEHSYGDIVTKTSESSIKFKSPGSAATIDATAIHSQVKLGSSTKSLPDPKTIFERPADLAAFEKYATPYLAVGIETLQRAVPPPRRGTIIAMDVPVALPNGSDAVMKVETPWLPEPNGKVKIRSWWIAQSNFAKGSAFNP